MWLAGRGFDRSEASRATVADRRTQRLTELTSVAIGLGADLERAERLADPAQRELAVRAAIGERLASLADPVLWIVDDLGPDLGEDEVRAWLAPGVASNAVSLVTTRTTTYGALLPPLPLGQLDPAEGYALLTQTQRPTDPTQRAAARELVTLLGGHAQALDVTRAAISTPNGFSRQLARIETAEQTIAHLDHLAELVSGSLPGGHRRNVAATLALSIDALDAPA